MVGMRPIVLQNLQKIKTLLTFLPPLYRFKRAAAGFAEYLGLIRATIEEGQRAGVFRPNVNAKVVAKILFGALDEMATNWILSKRRYKLTPMADQVLDIFLNGVSTR